MQRCWNVTWWNKIFLLDSLGVLHDCPEPSVVPSVFVPPSQVSQFILWFPSVTSVSVLPSPVELNRKIQYFIEQSCVISKWILIKVFTSPFGHCSFPEGKQKGDLAGQVFFLSRLLLSWKQQHCQQLISCSDQSKVWQDELKFCTFRKNPVCLRWYKASHFWVHQEDERSFLAELWVQNKFYILQLYKCFGFLVAYFSELLLKKETPIRGSDK